ncbi:acetyl-CoA carboxylase biotin carboxyl carrier protein [Marinoscillum sp. 108]|uniref:Biotin carboxyl carrier protein of acetyl-CoA carboxylase n=1 Tax=Marinoscillum luteum TaxID=861051 RepID=A0ABW7NAB3_9BACT|nr:acetyl-CoA carboxylase biotin carboxyl carrier protein [Marinoscillum sp. 108]VXD16455.1 Biotin carboxyl carrier protein of acetyl-CoA carboxylase [Marinoscillum sp. 108]
MKAKEIRDLIDFISGSGLEEVNIETEEFKINVKRSSPQVTVAAAPAPAAPAAPAPAPAPAAASEAPKAAPAAPAPASDAHLITIKSPMIGTFYRSANPESPAFVNVGDAVKQGDPVCIIEAMKLFNEIESEISGKIVKVLVEDAQPVEYDQPLFLVDPS